MDITPVFGTVIGGSNPSRSTENFLHLYKYDKNFDVIILNMIQCFYKCGVGLVVEHDLAKVETGVRFSHAALQCLKKILISPLKTQI